MKKFLKRFIKLSWKGIPIGIIASVLLCTVVVAATYLTVIQHITQEIVEEAPPPEYGSITAPDISLSKVLTNHSVLKEQDGAVVVQLEADGVGKFLHLKLDEASTNLYTEYEVKVWGMDNPMATTLMLTVDKAGPLEQSIQLTHVGTYTFTERITARTGGAPGTADVELTITLEDVE